MLEMGSAVVTHEVTEISKRNGLVVMLVPNGSPCAAMTYALLTSAAALLSSSHWPQAQPLPMPNILDHVSSTPVLEIDDWPRSATRKDWFAITRRIVQDTIADMNLDPAAEAEVIAAFIGAGLLGIPLPINPSQSRQSVDPIHCGDGVASGLRGKERGERWGNKLNWKKHESENWKIISLGQ